MSTFFTELMKVRTLATGLLVFALLMVSACRVDDTNGLEVEGPDTTIVDDLDLTMTGEADTVHVRLSEYTIDMPTSIPAGNTVFHIMNEGTVEHGLEIEGQDFEESLMTNLSPGSTGTLDVDLEPGTYEVYCPVGDHAEQGMRLTLTVTQEHTQTQ